MQKQWIAKRRIGRTRVGEPVKVPGNVARAMVALGFIAEAPPMAPLTPSAEPAALLAPKRSTYKRRDMAPAATKDVVTEPTPRPVLPPWPGKDKPVVE